MLEIVRLNPNVSIRNFLIDQKMIYTFRLLKGNQIILDGIADEFCRIF